MTYQELSGINGSIGNNEPVLSLSIEPVAEQLLFMKRHINTGRVAFQQSDEFDGGIRSAYHDRCMNTEVNKTAPEGMGKYSTYSCAEIARELVERVETLTDTIDQDDGYMSVNEYLDIFQAVTALGISSNRIISIMEKSPTFDDLPVVTFKNVFDHVFISMMEIADANESQMRKALFNDEFTANRFQKMLTIAHKSHSAKHSSRAHRSAEDLKETQQQELDRIFKEKHPNPFSIN